jgi:hypothetical protein
VLRGLPSAGRSRGATAGLVSPGEVIGWLCSLQDFTNDSHSGNPSAEVRQEGNGTAAWIQVGLAGGLLNGGEEESDEMITASVEANGRGE